MKLIFLVALLSLGIVNQKNLDVEYLNISTPNYVLFDYHNSEILVSSNENQKLPIASMTKMMGMLLVFEALENDNLKKDEYLSCSLEASKIGGSQIYLEENEKMQVEDLIKAVLIASANDAMYLLGEKVGGSNLNFVRMMNDKAKELKMENTNFANVVGFDDDCHYSSALDMAILAANLIRKYPDVLNYTNVKEDYLRKDTSSPFWLVNTNKMIGNYEGMDGLKTGYTNKAKYCLTATCEKDNIRLISVVIGAMTIKNRTSDTKRLLDYGYSILRSKCLYRANEVIKEITIDRKCAGLYLKEDLNIIYKNGEELTNLKEEVKLIKKSLPFKKDELAGVLVIEVNGKKYEASLYFSNSLKKDSFFKILINNLLEMLFC